MKSWFPTVENKVNCQTISMVILYRRKNSKLTDNICDYYVFFPAGKISTFEWKNKPTSPKCEPETTSLCRM